MSGLLAAQAVDGVEYEYRRTTRQQPCNAASQVADQRTNPAQAFGKMLHRVAQRRNAVQKDATAANEWLQSNPLPPAVQEEVNRRANRNR